MHVDERKSNAGSKILTRLGTVATSQTKLFIMGTKSNWSQWTITDGGYSQRKLFFFEIFFYEYSSKHLTVPLYVFIPMLNRNM